MKNILVPCDFSGPAINAYRFALNVAEQTKATVHLLHVIELPVLHDTVLMPVLNFEEALLKELKEKAEAELGKITSKYNNPSVKIKTAVTFGAVSKIIQDHIVEKAIDFVIMGSHGATGLREMFVGSNAEKVSRFSPVPVLVMKGHYERTVKNIVFPNTLDQENQEDLVMRVKALQHLFQAKLHVLWVNTPVNFTSDTITMKRLEEFAKKNLLKNYTINVFNHTDEERGIFEFSNAIGADMIAMGTHGRKGVAHLINGSLAEDVVNHYNGLVWTFAFKNKLQEA